MRSWAYYRYDAGTLGSDEGYLDRWYSPEVKSYVREVAHTPDGDWIKRLMGYNVPEPANSLDIDPREAEIGDEVTVTGVFPNHPN